MFTNIIKSDRNRERLELSNRETAVPLTLENFWWLFTLRRVFSSIFCSWCQKTWKFYLNLNHGRKIWDKVLASAWHVAEPWIFHPDFLSHGDTDLWNLGDTWRTFEYLKSGSMNISSLNVIMNDLPRMQVCQKSRHKRSRQNQWGHAMQWLSPRVWHAKIFPILLMNNFLQNYM